MSQYSGKLDFFDVISLNPNAKVVDFFGDHVNRFDFPSYYSHQVLAFENNTIFLSQYPIYYSESIPMITKMIDLAVKKKVADVKTQTTIGKFRIRLYDMFPMLSYDYLDSFLYCYLEDPTRSAMDILLNIGPLPLYRTFFDAHMYVLE